MQKLLRIKPTGGTLYHLDPVALATARSALEAFLATPGTFAIETAQGSKVDFLSNRLTSKITLDCWFFDIPAEHDMVDTAVIRRADAPALLETIFETSSDEAVVARIRELEQQAA
ncbi:MAG: hypothetical protein L0Z55_02570 [Planctomycetes bacterium]|nr:hypothetical protein [Planctomycetota bacterium]